MRSFKKVETFTLSTKHSTQVYLREVERIPLLTPQQEFEVATAAAAGDQTAIDKLVKANLRFVLSVAKMYASSEELQQEMVAVGNIGLVDAAKRFDPTKGFKFISFAVWHIRKEMILWLQKNKRTVYIPPAHLQLLKKSEEIAQNLYTKLGREPSDVEIYAELKDEKDEMKKTSSFENYKSIRSQEYGFISLDKPLDSTQDSTFYDVLDGGFMTPHEVLATTESDNQFSRLLGCLDPTERQVVEMHYGVNSMCAYTYPEIGEKIGVPKQKVEIIHRRAIGKLQRTARRIKFNLEAI